MSEFGEHASEWKPEYGENWGKNGLLKNPRGKKEPRAKLSDKQGDEPNPYKLAVKLHEMNLGSFMDCAKAAKENGCSESASIQALQRK